MAAITQAKKSWMSRLRNPELATTGQGTGPLVPLPGSSNGQMDSTQEKNNENSQDWNNNSILEAVVRVIFDIYPEQTYFCT